MTRTDDKPRAWASDWLYRPVIEQVEQLWKEIHERAADPRFAKLMGTPPDRFRIEEWTGANWEQPTPGGSLCRVWNYDGNTLQLEPEQALDVPVDYGLVRGAFSQLGLVQFHISADRKRAYFGYVLGPRYGRGMVFHIVVEGERAEWTLDPESPILMS